jgi:GTP cyclohydrolase I
MISQQDKRRAVRELIKAMGESPMRDGLRDTPRRVVASWDELFSGYDQDPESILSRAFTEHENYDQIVALKDIEFYSTCEHHMLPFYGKAHIAYLPSRTGGVVGISKLARLLDCYSRRLQIQERIGQQVVSALNDYLVARGAACVLEAKHLCMMCRGVRKFNSVMVTSSVTGVFRENQGVKLELMALLGLNHL